MNKVEARGLATVETVVDALVESQRQLLFSFLSLLELPALHSSNSGTCRLTLVTSKETRRTLSLLTSSLLRQLDPMLLA